MALFKRRRPRTIDISGLGRAVIALRLGGDDAAAMPDPAVTGAVVVIVDAGGRARRSLSFRTVAGTGEAVYCFHPGPYSVDLMPFPAAPELGLRLSFVVDAADPRVTQQRFDLFLFSEADVAVVAPLTLERFAAMLEAALRGALAQGNLDLPPCTTPDEWNAFRAGLNQLLYTRFGITVDDCLPVDLGDRVDFAAILGSRAAAAAADDGATPVPQFEPAAATGAGAAPSTPSAPSISPPPDVAADDARALRRLFLELPAVTGALRLLDLPAGQPWFQTRQRLLQRFDLAGIEAATMPSLGWATPDRRLDAGQQRRRAAASLDAVHALDEAWALLARLQLAGIEGLPALLDDTDRIASNLERALELRRLAFVVLDERGTDAPDAVQERREPI
jgi:hypothetical protein